MAQNKNIGNNLTEPESVSIPVDADVMPDWMDEARQLAAQCWCDKETENKVMDTELAEAVAKRIAAWMDTAAHNQRNADYYRALLVRCGKAIGDRAFISDDGTRQEDVLCAKIPEIIETDYVNGGGA